MNKILKSKQILKKQDSIVFYRKQIDEIDKQMAELFEKRLGIVENVRQYKLNHNMPTYVPNREKSMHEKNQKFIKNKNILSYYDEFLTACTTISKKYQNDQNQKEINNDKIK